MKKKIVKTNIETQLNHNKTTNKFLFDQFMVVDFKSQFK